MGGAFLNPLFTLEYVVLAAALVTAAAAVLAWRTSAKCRPAQRITVVVCRALGIGCLAFLALNPGRWRQERLGKDSEWAVLADRSLSMSTADENGKARWDEAVRLAKKAMACAKDKTKAGTYAFSDELETVPGEGLAGLKPDGRNTDILQAGRSLLNRSRSGGKRLAGVILISDGRQVAQAKRSDLAIACRSQESPIFALPLGGEVKTKDLSVAAARRQYVSFVGQKLKIGGLVRNEGLGKISVEASLLDSSGKEAGRQKVDVSSGESVPAQFELTPEAKGYYEYVLKVPAWEGESVVGNNEAAMGVAVLESKMRVFTAEGTPGWDSKFLAQLLRKQANMEVTSVYRISSDRYFKVETDASKVSEGTEAIFPDNADALAAYDVIVFGKGVEYFLTPERIKLLRGFVKDQGGCVFFSRGKPYNRTLAELEFLEPVAWGEPVGASFRFRPARAGENMGLFGDMLAGPQDPVWNKLPALQYASRCSNLKAFSHVLVEGVFESAGREVSFPVVVSRRFGKGMVIVVNAEGMWQWDFFPSVNEASNMYKEIWAQLLQWAVTYSEFLPGQEFSLSLSENSVLPDTPVSIRVSGRREAGKSAAPAIRVMSGGTPVQELQPVAVAGTENRWLAIHTPGQAGTFRIELAAAGQAAGRAPCAILQVRAPPAEKDNLSADRAFLERLAGESGGGIIAEKELAKTVAQFETVPETGDVSKAIWTPLWDRWWVLCAMLGFFGVEWFVRRRNGLM